MFERARDYSKSALSSIGLQPRRTAADYVLPALGLFGVGLLVGVGLGLILAPKPGVELRGDIGRRVRKMSIRRRRNHDSLDSQERDAAHEDGADGADVPSTAP